MSSQPQSRRGLYAIVDPDACGGRDPEAVARAVLDGGCAVLQLRAKRLGAGATLTLARRLAAACREHSVAFVMNDRPDLAVLAGASCVHLGQDDLSIEDARKIVGSMPIGVSAHTINQALDAESRGAALIGFGPVFSTGSKESPDPVVGLDGLRAVCGAVRVPVAAIGGIDVARAAEVARCGAQLVAAINAVCGAGDPRAAARAFHGAIVAVFGQP